MTVMKAAPIHAAKAWRSAIRMASRGSFIASLAEPVFA
jgi:hypothetical protein